MGANEYGVVIGNEAVFTKVPYRKKPGLIGMDFLRLALERASSADEALDVMIGLLEKYGQGGNCGFAHALYYHNGFLIADRENAWVFETAGQHWAAQKVQDVRSISNVISITTEWDRASKGLVDYELDKGWCKNRDDFNFSRCYSDFIFTKFSDGRHRLCRTTDLLTKKMGEIDVPFAMGLLRDHGPKAGKDWQPGRGLSGAEVCMHASFGPIRISQTTGSMISHLSPGGDTHWVTGTAAPCTSVFKPIWMDAGLPELGPQPTGNYDEATLWWRHENLHREMLRDYASRNAIVQDEREALEKMFLERSRELSMAASKERKAFSQEAFETAKQIEAKWLHNIIEMPVTNRRPFLDKFAWRKFDQAAKRHWEQ